MKTQNTISEQWTTVIRPRTGWFDIDLKGIHHYRDLILLLVKRDFSLIYKQTILGPLWVIIQPLLTTVVFTVVFGNIAGLPTDGVPKFLFYMAGSIVWQFFSKCMVNISKTFIVNRNLFGKVYFPRLCMPIATVITQLINFAIQFVMFCGFVAYFALQPNSVVVPNWKLIALTPLILLQLGILGLGCGVIISALTTKYRDLQMLVAFGEHLWMYATPITYSSTLISGKYPHLIGLYMLNPITPVVELFRAAYLGVNNDSSGYILISVVVTLVIAVLGVILFSHTEKNFMDTV